MFGEFVFQQTVGIPMGANFSPLLVDLFMYSNEADFIQRLLKKDEKKLAGSFNVTFHYKTDVLSLNIARLADFVGCIYPIELEIKVAQLQKGMFHILTYAWKLTVRGG
jgi:hypothetical protein